MKLRRTLLLAGIYGAALLFASCGGGGERLPASPDAVVPGIEPVQPVQPDAVLERFALRVNPESYLADSSIEGLRLESQVVDGETLVQVIADNAIALRALYFSLEYDERAYSPLAAEATDALQGPALELPILQEAGELQYGHVLIDPLSQPGYSGSGVIAELRFANHVFDPTDNTQPLPKSVSKLAPQPRFFLLSLDEPGENFRLAMPYVLPGDYDQNSEVNVADLTPLAVHFGKKAPFSPGSVETVVDGDNNGEINIADISVIGANFKNSFVSARALSGSQQDLDEGTGTELAAWNYDDDAQGVPSQQRLWFDTYVNSIASSTLCWVELSSLEGGASAPLQLSDPIAPVNAGQRVMSLNAQAWPLQLEPGGTVNVLCDTLAGTDFEAGLRIDFGDGTVEHHELATTGNFSSELFSHEYAASGSYELNCSWIAASDEAVSVAGLLPVLYERIFTVSCESGQSPGLLPQLAMSPQPAVGVGEPVSLDAGTSTPAGGTTIDNYEWDFNCDGVFDSAGTESAVQFTPEAADVDLGLATVRLTDSAGGQASASRAFIYNRAGAPAVSCSLIYDGSTTTSSDTDFLATVQVHAEGLDSMAGLPQYSIVVIPPGGGDPDVVATQPDTDVNLSLSGAGEHIVRAVLSFAGSELCSDETTITLGARAIELAVEPANTTIKAPITFTATAEEPGLIDHYIFDFGDGNQQNTTSASVTHEYTVKQNYDATVTAFWTDDKQNTSAPVHVVCGFERLVELEVDTNPALLDQELNFTASVDFPELITEYTYDFGDGSELTTTDTSVPYTYTTLGSYNARLIAVYSDGPTTVSNNLAITVQDPGQLVTEPLLEIVSEENDFPKLVAFSAANTKFKVGTNLLAFSIDFGDGYSITNITDINQIVYHAYYSAGDFTATLTVRDTDFEQNTDDIGVSVVDPGGKFQYTTIAGTPNTFEAARIMPVRGTPNQFVWSARAAGGSDGFAVKNGVNDLYHLYIAEPADNAATSWNAPVKILEAKGIGINVSAATTPAGPAVAYYQYKSIVDPFPDDGDLYYCAATNAGGSAWDTPVLVSDTGDVGRYPALAIVNGNPAIASRLSTSSTEGTGRYIRASAADGSAWGSFVDIGAAAANEAFFSMMTVSDGGSKPAVAMQLGVGGQFRLGFQVADDADGAGWTAGDTLSFTDNDRGYGVDMQSWSSVPWVAFGDSIGGRVYFSSADDGAGSSWSTPSYVFEKPAGTTVPQAFSLGHDGILPSVLVSYGSDTAGRPGPVYLATAMDATGEMWNAPEIVGWTVQFHAAAFGDAVDGSQLIVFYDNLDTFGGQGQLRSGARLQP